MKTNDLARSNHQSEQKQKNITISIAAGRYVHEMLYIDVYVRSFFLCFAIFYTMFVCVHASFRAAAQKSANTISTMWVSPVHLLESK